MKDSLFGIVGKRSVIFCHKTMAAVDVAGHKWKTKGSSFHKYDRAPFIKRRKQKQVAVFQNRHRILHGVDQNNMIRCSEAFCMCNSILIERTNAADDDQPGIRM